jgi:SAM-dependent methyltransferase
VNGYDADLTGRTLGCGDGPASFNAGATANGHAVTSCDPVYDLSAAEIERRVKNCCEDVIVQMRDNREDFVWDYFQDPDDLGRRRLDALSRFLADFESGKAAGRYVTAALPNLPFGDDQFDLAVVSHLLFLYSEHLSLEFHLKAVDELLRVAKEVRIFPLRTLGRHPSPHLGPTRTHLAGRGFSDEIRRVPYEFQRGVNEMLSVKK